MIATRPNGVYTSVIAVPKTPILEGRFWAKVEKTEDCWLWRGRVNPSGMGQMRIASGSRGPQGGTRIDAHKLAYLWYVGPIPEGWEVDHLCRVAICIRPDHLEAVTQEINQQRAHFWRVRDKLRAEVLAAVRFARARARAGRELRG